MNFLPGEPNSTKQAVCFVKWDQNSVFTYCSGNNLIILTKLLSNLQTIYFKHNDLTCVDINPNNGLIAVAGGLVTYIYKPIKLYSYNKAAYWNWQFSNEIVVDLSTVRSLSWGNETEIIIGTDQRLSLYYVDRLDEYSNYIAQDIWHQPLANPCYLIRFSSNSELIACISKYDKLIKFFYRTNFDVNNTQFNLLYLKHSSHVIDFKFRFIDHSTLAGKTSSSNYNILYTVSNDNYIRVFLSFEFQKSKKIQHWGSLKLSDSSLGNSKHDDKMFIKIIDNYFFDYMITRSLSRFHKHSIHGLENNLKKLKQLQSDLIMVSDIKGNLSFYLVTNLNLNPPKSILFKKLSFNKSQTSNGDSTLPPTPTSSFQSNTIQFPPGTFPSQPEFLIFSDSIKIYKNPTVMSKKVTFANYDEHTNYDELSNVGDLAFIIHDLVKKTLRYVYLRLDDFLLNINYDALYNNYDELYLNNLNKSITNLSMRNPNASSMIDSSLLTTNTSITTTIQEYLTQNSSTFQYLNAILGNKITGHNKSIQKLFKDISGEAVLSISRFSEHKLWTPLKLNPTNKVHPSSNDVNANLTFITLRKQSTIATSNNIISAILLRSGDIIVTYSIDHTLTLWDTRDLKLAKNMKETRAIHDATDVNLLAFFHLPEYHHDYQYNIHYIVAIYSVGHKYITKAWTVDLKDIAIQEIEIDSLTEQSDIKISCISPVDPVGWNISLNNFNRDILTLITTTGVLKSYSVNIDCEGTPKIKWVNICSIETNIINASYIKGSSISKIAVVNESRDKLFIYNTSYPMLEYSHEFNKEFGTICDVDWANITSKSFKQTKTNRNTPCVLSVGFEHVVLLFTQLNFDYTNNLPSFALIKQIRLDTYTQHVINDSIWLTDGLLIMGTGNQLFLSDNYSENSLTTSMIAQDNFTKKIIGDRLLNNNSINSIFSLVEILNNTLPVYHPQFIIQCIYFGKINLVKKILLHLYLYLKKVDLEENNNEDENSDDEPTKDRKKKFKIRNLPRSLGISVDEFYNSGSANSKFNDSDTSSLFLNSNNFSPGTTDLYTTENFKTWVKQFRELLIMISLPILTRHQQMTLLTVIESVEIIDKYKLLTGGSSHRLGNSEEDETTFDLNGVNFLLGYKLYQSHVKTQPGLNMRDNMFGVYCQNKEILLEIINGKITVDDNMKKQESKMTWSRCKKTGLVYWLSDELLIEQFETIANNEFQNSSSNEDTSYTHQLARLEGKTNHAVDLDKMPYFESNKARNPMNSTIFYLALQKKAILVKLWKISYGHPEQAKMVKFLSMDFENVEKNRITAVKNAFALLSKHRYYLASCFFLLGGCLNDCVSVLIKKCDDLELGIAVARVYESFTKPTINMSGGSIIGKTNLLLANLDSQKEKPRGPVFTKILIEQLLPFVLTDGDRWVNTYIYRCLHEDQLALLALIKSPYEVLKQNVCADTNQPFCYLRNRNLLPMFKLTLDAYEKQKLVKTTQQTVNLSKNKEIIVSNNNIFLKTDPVSVIIYKELRNEIFKKKEFASGYQTNQKDLDLWKEQVSRFNQYEFDYIHKITLIYSRMGCDYLSIDLLKNWQFSHWKFTQFLKEHEKRKTESTVKSNFGTFLGSKHTSGFSNNIPTQNSIQEFNFDSFDASVAPLVNRTIEKQSSETVKTTDSVATKFNKAPPPPVAFEEPDMSAFDFGM